MADVGSTRAKATPVLASKTGAAAHPPERATSKSAKAQQPWWRSLGPGLITGAADDDPSGIATYSQGGAQFGYDVAWTILLTYPLMVAIQLASARIGRVTGRGLADTFARFCPAWTVYGLVPPCSSWPTSSTSART